MTRANRVIPDVGFLTLRDAETDELLELDTRHPRVRALFAKAAQKREDRAGGLAAPGEGRPPGDSHRSALRDQPAKVLSHARAAAMIVIRTPGRHATLLATPSKAGKCGSSLARPQPRGAASAWVCGIGCSRAADRSRAAGGRSQPLCARGKRDRAQRGEGAGEAVGSRFAARAAAVGSRGDGRHGRVSARRRDQAAGVRTGRRRLSRFATTASGPPSPVRRTCAGSIINWSRHTPAST